MLASALVKAHSFRSSILGDYVKVDFLTLFQVGYIFKDGGGLFSPIIVPLELR